MRCKQEKMPNPAYNKINAQYNTGIILPCPTSQIGKKQKFEEYPAGKVVRWQNCSHTLLVVGQNLTHLSWEVGSMVQNYLHLPYDLAIPILGIYPEGIPPLKETTETRLFIEVPFIVAKDRKQSKYAKLGSC